MPAASRRKAKKAKKLTTVTKTNHHSSPTVQLQGHCDLKPLKEELGSLAPICLRYPYVVVEEKKSNIKGNSLSVGAAFTSNHFRMEGSINGALEEETQKVESLSEDKEVVVEVAADGKTQDGDSAITDEQAIILSEENTELVHSGKVEHTEDASESIVDSLEPAVSSPNDFNDAIEAAQVDNTLASDTVELEMNEEDEKAFVPHEPEGAAGLSQVVANHWVEGLAETALPPSEDNNELPSVSENEVSRETEVVETVNDVAVAEEEKNVLSSFATDVPLKETLETDIPKSDENDKVSPTRAEEIPKGSERSWVPSIDEKVGDVQEPSYGSAKEESFQPLANVPDAETTSVTVQNENEIPRRTENQAIVSVAPRQHTSWSSCCGIFEVLRRGDR